MEHRREARGLQRLLHAGSVTVARGLSYPVACGILQDQSSSLRPLHWQMDSYPPPHWVSVHFPLSCAVPLPSDHPGIRPHWAVCGSRCRPSWGQPYLQARALGPRGVGPLTPSQVHQADFAHL